MKSFPYIVSIIMFMSLSPTLSKAYSYLYCSASGETIKWKKKPVIHLNGNSFPEGADGRRSAVMSALDRMKKSGIGGPVAQMDVHISNTIVSGGNNIYIGSLGGNHLAEVFPVRTCIYENNGAFVISEITRADIVFNKNYYFHPYEAFKNYSLQDVLYHEMGHFWGFEHEGLFPLSRMATELTHKGLGSWNFKAYRALIGYELMRGMRAFYGTTSNAKHDFAVIMAHNSNGLETFIKDNLTGRPLVPVNPGPNCYYEITSDRPYKLEVTVANESARGDYPSNWWVHGAVYASRNSYITLYDYKVSDGHWFRVYRPITIEKTFALPSRKYRIGDEVYLGFVIDNDSRWPETDDWVNNGSPQRCKLKVVDTWF